MLKAPDDIDFVVEPVNLTPEEVAQLSAQIARIKAEKRAKREKSRSRRGKPDAGQP